MQSALFENILLNASHSSVARSRIPAFLYGCAWKKEQTSDLVYKALSSGFRGLDVANQHHYREDLTGDGMRRAITEGKVTRQELFVQTKFTSVDGHDPRNMPYDPKSPIKTQVETSIAASLRNLLPADDLTPASEDTYLDCLVLHSPLRTLDQTEEAWRTAEQYVPSKIRNLGISNTTLPILEALWESSNVKPAVVQNRFYMDTRYELELRKFCKSKGIVFQSFWTLTANPHLLKHPSVQSLAKRLAIDRGAALYGLVLGLEGTIICNGTQNHMLSDLQDLEKVKAFAQENDYEWKNSMKMFRDAIGEYPEDVSAGTVNQDLNRARKTAPVK